MNLKTVGVIVLAICFCLNPFNLSCNKPPALSPAKEDKPEIRKGLKTLTVVDYDFVAKDNEYKAIFKYKRIKHYAIQGNIIRSEEYERPGEPFQEYIFKYNEILWRFKYKSNSLTNVIVQIFKF